MQPGGSQKLAGWILKYFPLFSNFFQIDCHSVFHGKSTIDEKLQSTGKCTFEDSNKVLQMMFV